MKNTHGEGTETDNVVAVPRVVQRQLDDTADLAGDRIPHLQRQLNTLGGTDLDGGIIDQQEIKDHRDQECSDWREWQRGRELITGDHVRDREDPAENIYTLRESFQTNAT